MSTLLLADLGSMYWRAWFTMGSQFEAFSRVIDTLAFKAPDYDCIIVCADSPRNWRHALDPQYKANRKKKAPEAVLTLLDVEDRLATLGYPLAKADGYEADDLIATLAKQAEGRTVEILSEDKDLYQLISPTCTQLTKGGAVTPDGCVRKFGVGPGQMRDLLTLWGDSADNVPGCEGVGHKKAVTLLERYGTVENVVAADVEDLMMIKGIGNSIARAVSEWRDWELHRRLVSLDTCAPADLGALELAAKYDRGDDEIEVTE